MTEEELRKIGHSRRQHGALSDMGTSVSSSDIPVGELSIEESLFEVSRLLRDETVSDASICRTRKLHDCDC